MPDQKLIEIQNWVQGQVTPARFQHIQGVVKTAEKLAAAHGLPVSKARLAAWLHDCAKELPRSKMKAWLVKGRVRLDAQEKQIPALWHPQVGAAIAKKMWGIKDPAVLEAIQCHTLGKAGMRPLAQAVFISDFIEPGRNFPEVSQARARADEGLAKGVLAKASMTIEFLFQKKMRVHPRLLETWNYFLSSEKNEKHSN
jgi:predicted HD superfamily hydrolase involved in NAD metabolism